MKIKSFVLNPFGINCYLYYDEKTGEGILIDPAISSEEEKTQISRYIESEKVKIKYIINTHGHLDHVIGNKWAKDTFSAPLYFHEKDKPLVEKVTEQGLMFGIDVFAQPEADKFITEGDIITFNNCKLKIIHTPGHSSGSICLVDEENKVIFSGDTLFNNSIGRTDLPGGDMKILLDSINLKILCYPDDFEVYPGHMESTTIGDEKKYNPFLNGEYQG